MRNRTYLIKINVWVDFSAWRWTQWPGRVSRSSVSARWASRECSCRRHRSCQQRRLPALAVIHPSFPTKVSVLTSILVFSALGTTCYCPEHVSQQFSSTDSLNFLQCSASQHTKLTLEKKILLLLLQGFELATLWSRVHCSTKKLSLIRVRLQKIVDTFWHNLISTSWLKQSVYICCIKWINFCVSICGTVPPKANPLFSGNGQQCYEMYPVIF